MGPLAAGFLAATAAITSSARAATAPSFTGLGDLPGGTFDSLGLAISADGAVVVGQSRSGAANGAWEAFVWTSSAGMVGLGGLPGFSVGSQAFAVSGDGLVVVGAALSTNDATEAFLWSPTAGMTGLGDLPGGEFESLAFGTSSDGSVVVGAGRSAASDFTYEAFRWTQADGMIGLGDLPGGEFFSMANAISADGAAIVGQSETELGVAAFRWTAPGGMISLGDLAGGEYYANATAVSAEGATIVGYSSSAMSGIGAYEAFRWTKATGMVGLGDLPGGAFFSNANAVSADGLIVVGFGVATSGVRAFIWDPIRGIRDFQTFLTQDLGLDLTGWTLTEAKGISADGTVIAGYGRNPNGRLEAWRACVPPMDLQPPSMIEVSSMATHDTGEFGIPVDIADNVRNIEPRNTRVQKLEVTFSEDMAPITPEQISIQPPVSVTVNTTMAAGDRLTILFSPALPGEIAHRISIAAADLAGNPLSRTDDDFCIAGLPGDLDADGFVTPADKATLLGFVFQVVGPANNRYDVAVGGGEIINVEDVATWNGFFGQTAMDCP